MLAPGNRDLRSDETQPACLLRENPNRLVSLWEIVNQFSCGKLLIVFKRLQIVRDLFSPNDNESLEAFEEWVRQKYVERGQNDLPVGAEATLEELRELRLHLQGPVREVIDALKELCEECGFTDALITIRFAGHHLRENPSHAELRSELRHLEEALFMELTKRNFLRVDPERVSLLDQDALFGPEVDRAFPSASRDIRYAGNSLAAELGTGAVFHLMRAAEVALRALAADRRVAYPNASLSSRQVGDLLSSLEGKMLEMRKADASVWPSRDIKDAQISFYHRAVAEFRDFNEAWRKHMAHAHEGAFYDIHQALSILNHVRECMKVLSERISEAALTELYWTVA